MTQPAHSEAALEMRRYLKELGDDDHWGNHQDLDEDSVIEELTTRLVDAQSVQELVTVF